MSRREPCPIERPCLADLRQDEEAIIVDVDLCSDGCARLCELGLAPGVNVTMICPGRTTLVKGLSDYRPGETFLIVGELLRVPEIEQRYERCTLEIRYRPAPSERPDEQNPIASYCVERGKELEPREGACEGLAPGSATVRLDEHLRATIERGSHREGPFDLGSAGSMQPLLDSLVRSNDESVVFVAPPELPQADVLALIEGVRRALPRRPVSVSLP